MVAMLTRAIGFDRLQVAEDAMQDALLTAMRSWGLGGVPRNPSAWLMRVAKNRALDTLRRETNFRSKEKELTAFFEHRPENGGESCAMKRFGWPRSWSTIQWVLSPKRTRCSP